MQPIRIGIDIDGVLSKTQELIIPMFNDRFNANVNASECYKYDVEDIYGPGAQDYFNEKQGEIFANTLPYDDARKVLSYLKGRKADIFYVSARDREFHELTRNWLNRNRLEFSKIMVLGVKDKADMARKLRLDFFIEDEPNNIRALSKVLQVVKLEHLYNKHVLGDNIVSAENWDEVLRFFKRV